MRLDGIKSQTGLSKSMGVGSSLSLRMHQGESVSCCAQWVSYRLCARDPDKMKRIRFDFQIIDIVMDNGQSRKKSSSHCRTRFRVKISPIMELGNAFQATKAEYAATNASPNQSRQVFR